MRPKLDSVTAFRRASIERRYQPALERQAAALLLILTKGTAPSPEPEAAEEVRMQARKPSDRA
jgi:hypothetical protein